MSSFPDKMDPKDKVKQKKKYEQDENKLQLDVDKMDIDLKFDKDKYKTEKDKDGKDKDKYKEAKDKEDKYKTEKEKDGKDHKFKDKNKAKTDKDKKKEKAEKTNKGGKDKVIKETKKRRKKPMRATWATYIHKVLKTVHEEDCTLSSKAMQILDSFANDLFERISTEAVKLLRLNNKRTLTSMEIQTAARLVLPGELCKHAIQDGAKAVSKYQLAEP